MDVAYYLSELLGQIGEVNVPGLGYFVQQRVNGYYNEVDGSFYPPTSKLQFDPQFMDEDNVLAQFIAEKKKISLASSKYFTDKYLTTLKQEAMTKDVAFADLGTLHYDSGVLSFNPASELTNNPAFYGYEPVALGKLGPTSYVQQLESIDPRTNYAPPVPEPGPYTAPEPVLRDEPVASPEVFTPAPEPEYVAPPYAPPAPAYTPPPPVYTPPQHVYPEPDPELEEEFIFRGKTYEGGDEDEDYRPRSYRWIWITLLILIVLGAGGIFAIYKYKPALFNRLRGIKPAPIELKIPLTHDTLKTITPAIKGDTSKHKQAVIVDTTTKMAVKTAVPVKEQLAPIIDSTKARYEIIGTRCSTMEEAELRVKNFKSLGIKDAHILNEPGLGRLIKISLGTYDNRENATGDQAQLLKTGNVQPDIYILKINPRK